MWDSVGRIGYLLSKSTLKNFAEYLPQVLCMSMVKLEIIYCPPMLDHMSSIEWLSRKGEPCFDRNCIDCVQWYLEHCGGIHVDICFRKAAT